MGVESFFFNLLPEGVSYLRGDGANGFHGRSTITVADAVERIRGTPFEVDLKKADKLVVNKGLLLSLGASEGYLQELCVEGCFSWYERCMDLCYELAFTIDRNVVQVSFHYPPDICMEIGTSDTFCSKMHELHDRRFKSFQKMFGHLDVQSLPGGDFYEMIKGRRRQSLWQRFRGISGL